MKIIKFCNFCGNKSLKFLFYGKDKNFYLPGKFPIVKCKKCGLIFIWIALDLKKLERYYPKKYYSYNKIDTNSFKLKIKMLLYNLYFNQNNLNPLLKLLFLPLLPFSRGAVILPGKKLLDIGSGSGQFLYEMKQFDMKLYGLEPGNFDKESAKKQGLNIKNADLLKARYPKEYFDIITINHVLEHVPDPAKNIEEIYRILKKNGKLIMGVPNYRSLAFFLFGRNWYQLDVPRHLHDFSDKILIRKLKEGGFKIRGIRYNSRPAQFTISLFYLFDINPKKHPIITNIFNIIFLPLTYAVNTIKWGDQIEIYCSK